MVELPPRPAQLTEGVSFASSCYEKDWAYLLPNSRLLAMLETLQYPFAHTLLVLNHQAKAPALEAAVTPYLKQGILDQVIRSQDYAQGLLDFFHISQRELYPGFHYLIQNLAALYFCPTRYLVWMTCDSLMVRQHPWIDAGIKMLKAEKHYTVVNPSWSLNLAEVRAEAQVESGDFYIGYGFSDQCFLIEVEEFLAPIYEFQHSLSARYPERSGRSFEKRIDAWMRSEKRLRLTHQRAVYLHRNFGSHL